MAINLAISFREFLRTCSDDFDDVSLSFDNVGTVQFTTITRANLELLNRSRAAGYSGIIISCPDFEKECIAVSFLAALLHLEHDAGAPGLHEVQEGERAALGSCVAIASEVNNRRVMFNTADETSGFDMTNKALAPVLVHSAPPDKLLSRTSSTKKRKRNSLRKALAKYNSLPDSIRHLLDLCGKPVASIGYCSSQSQYLNEPPTHIPKGHINIAGENVELSELLPITHFKSDGSAKNDFGWPFAAPPSILVCPRVSSVGTAFPILNESSSNDIKVDFVAFNIPSKSSLNTSLYTDLLDLRDKGIGLIGFCDRWTIDSIRDLKGEGFLLFDWGDCSLAEQSDSCRLSPIQQTIKSRIHEETMSVSDEDSGLWRAEQILYECLSDEPLNTDEALDALGSLFSLLGTAIRMTEAPDEDYALEQRMLIDDCLETIRQSMSLSPESLTELSEACKILKSVYQQGRRMPKEKKIYEIIANYLDAGQRVVLVVDKHRTKPVYNYWRSKLIDGGHDADLFLVINTYEFMASKEIQGNENVIFSGWYDRGTMDRALHSGIASNSIFVLYRHEGGDLEIDWWLRAQKQWDLAESRCFDDTNETLTSVGIEKMKNKPERYRAKTSQQSSPKERDESPAGIVNDIVRQRIQSDTAKTGEKSIRATPVLFDDGSHVWLKSNTGKSKEGRLVVITDCLDNCDAKPEQKTAAALLQGDVVLWAHSDRAYIRKTSEQTTKGYDEILSIAQKWKDPIQSARRKGLSDAEIADRISCALKGTRTMQAIRGWVKGDLIAPQTAEDIRAIYTGLDYGISDDDFAALTNAIRSIRNKHRAVGRIMAKKMVDQFLDDVRLYGLDDAVNGFDERHEAGDVELRKVTSIGDEMNVAIERAAIV